MKSSPSWSNWSIGAANENNKTGLFSSVEPIAGGAKSENQTREKSSVGTFLSLEEGVDDDDNGTRLWRRGAAWTIVINTAKNTIETITMIKNGLSREAWAILICWGVGWKGVLVLIMVIVIQYPTLRANVECARTRKSSIILSR